jgi:hypothetical protein
MTTRVYVHGVDCKVELASVRVKCFPGFRYEFFEILHVTKDLITVRTIFKLLHAWDICAVTYNISRIQNKRML